MSLKTRVGIRVKTVRKRRKLTQEQLAEKIDRSSDAVSAIERGKNLPNFETLKRLAKALDVPIREFFDFDDEVQSSPKRAALMTKITDAARSLPDSTLEIAADQIQALTKRGKQG